MDVASGLRRYQAPRPDQRSQQRRSGTRADGVGSAERPDGHAPSRPLWRWWRRSEATIAADRAHDAEHRFGVPDRQVGQPERVAARQQRAVPRRDGLDAVQHQASVSKIRHDVADGRGRAAASTTSLPGATVFTQNPRIEEAPLQGELMLFEPDSARFYVLIRTMAFVWRRCDGSHTPEAMLQGLRQEFAEVDAAAAEADLRAALGELVSLDLVVDLPTDERREATTGFAGVKCGWRVPDLSRLPSERACEA